MSQKSLGQVAVEAYEGLRPKYQSLAETVKHILGHAIPQDCRVHSIEARAKEVESFRRKAEKPAEGDRSKPKYTDPMAQITDLAGVRVIAFFPKSLQTICESIQAEFDVQSMQDIGEERLAQGRFGYQSIHFLVKLPSKKTEWAEYRRFRDMIVEIQVRTVLQHAWAEMEHDIQYKSLEQIPTSIQRRFLALAGMLELADREFQTIQDEDTSLRQAVKVSLKDELTRSAIQKQAGETADSSGPPSGTSSSVSFLSPMPPKNAKKVRELIADGDYAAAVALYTKMIDVQPGSHTLFIGRARAKFLSGDRSGALSDLREAELIHPEDQTVASLKTQIEDGRIYWVSTANDAWKLTTSGNERLADGNGEEAFRLYSTAQQLGFNPVFSAFNKSMACALMKDSDGAAYFLNELTPIKNTPTEINVLALNAIIAAVAKSGFSTKFRALQERLVSPSVFDFAHSPLRHLRAGFYARDVQPNPQVVSVFEAVGWKYSV